MAHPFADHRQTKVEHARVKDIVKGFARGGAVEPEMEDDDKPDTGRKAMRHGGKSEEKMEGKAAKHHMGKRKRGGKVTKRDDGGAVESPGTLRARREDIGAVRPKDNVDNVAPNSKARKGAWSGDNGFKRGGKVACAEGGVVPISGYKKGGKIAKGEKTAPMEDDDKPQRSYGGSVKRKTGQTIVNVMMGEKPQQAPPQQIPVKVPVPVPAPPPMAGPPPGMPPQGMPPGGPPPGAMPPPGLMGRAKGGKVTKGTPTYEDSLRNGTQVSHSPGKNDLNDLKIKSPIVPTRPPYAMGGATKSEGMKRGPHMDAGAGSGEGRLEKIGFQQRR
jgi:hypothetical protein